MNCYFRIRTWNATGVCNANCACPSDFGPVCGSDNVTYFSACYAGCRATGLADGAGGLKVECEFYVRQSESPIAWNIMNANWMKMATTPTSSRKRQRRCRRCCGSHHGSRYRRRRRCRGCHHSRRRRRRRHHYDRRLHRHHHYNRHRCHHSRRRHRRRHHYNRRRHQHYNRHRRRHHHFNRRLLLIIIIIVAVVVTLVAVVDIAIINKSNYKLDDDYKESNLTSLHNNHFTMFHQTYDNCSCVGDVTSGIAQSGWCDYGCSTLVPYAILTFMAMFFVSLGASPMMVTLTRYVDVWQHIIIYYYIVDLTRKSVNHSNIIQPTCYRAFGHTSLKDFEYVHPISFHHLLSSDHVHILPRTVFHCFVLHLLASLLSDASTKRRSLWVWESPTYSRVSCVSWRHILSSYSREAPLRIRQFIYNAVHLSCEKNCHNELCFTCLDMIIP